MSAMRSWVILRSKGASRLEVGEHLLQRVRVDAPAGHVLRAGEVAALDHEGRLAGLRELVGRHGARAPGAHDDRVEIGLMSTFLSSRCVSVFLPFRKPYAPERARSRSGASRGRVSAVPNATIAANREAAALRASRRWARSRRGRRRAGGRSRREAKGGCIRRAST